MIDFGHDVSAERANALADKQDQRRKDRAERPIRCPGCKRTDIDIVVGQYTWNTQDYTPSQDDWSASDYSYEGDIQIGARCRHCDVDLTRYLLRKGWSFDHDVRIPNRAHEKPTKKERALLPALDASAPQLQNAIDEAVVRLGRLLDEQERRRGKSASW